MKKQNLYIALIGALITSNASAKLIKQPAATVLQFKNTLDIPLTLTIYPGLGQNSASTTLVLEEAGRMGAWERL